jgi:hypothetical protein
MWTSARSVLILAPLSAAKSMCDIALSILFHVFNRTYGKKRNYFWHLARSSNNPVELQKKSSAKDLLNNAARVCDTHCRVTFNISSKKKSFDEIAMSVPDKYLMNWAMHKGFLAQSNNHLSPGVDFDELIKLEGAICEVEHVNGFTCTDLHGDLRMNNNRLSHTATQRGQNSGFYGATALSAVVGGGGGGGVSCAMGSHICHGVERVAMPEQWPFPKTPEHKSNIDDMDDMVGQAGTLAMKRMINKTHRESTGKKVCTV